MDRSLSGSSVHGILQARILEWVAVSSSRGSSQRWNPCLLCLLHWQVSSSALVPPQPVYSLSRVRLFATPWTAALQASLSITNSWHLLKLMSIVLVMPSNHLILFHPLLLLSSTFPSIRVFSNELVLRIRWLKYWSFSFSISPSNEYSGLISFRMNWLDLLAPRYSQESSPTPQLKSINSLVLRFLFFFLI